MNQILRERYQYILGLPSKIRSNMAEVTCSRAFTAY